MERFGGGSQRRRVVGLLIAACLLTPAAPTSSGVAAPAPAALPEGTLLLLLCPEGTDDYYEGCTYQDEGLLGTGLQSKKHHTNPELYAWKGGSTKPLRLTDNDVVEGSLVWSPQGKRIVMSVWDFEAEEYMECWLLKKRLGSNRERELPVGGTCVYPTDWSPDGRWILATSIGDELEEGPDLWKVSPDGKRRIQLRKADVDRDGIGGGRSGLWTRGGKIVYVHHGKKGYGLARMSADGRKSKLLFPHRPWSFAMSPDRARIAVVESKAPAFDIWIGRTNGSRFRRLPRQRGLKERIAWSPDGKTLAYLRTPWKKSGTRLYLMRLGSGRIRRMPIPETLHPHTFRWSPSGRYLAVLAGNGSGDSAVFTMTRKGKKFRRVTPFRGFIGLRGWRARI